MNVKDLQINEVSNRTRHEAVDVVVTQLDLGWKLKLHLYTNQQRRRKTKQVRKALAIIIVRVIVMTRLLKQAETEILRAL